MSVTKVKMVKRKRGNLVFLGVEIDVNQFQRFSEVCHKLEIPKCEAVSAALNIWLNYVDPHKEEKD